MADDNCSVSAYIPRLELIAAHLHGDGIGFDVPSQGFNLLMPAPGDWVPVEDQCATRPGYCSVPSVDQVVEMLTEADLGGRGFGAADNPFKLLNLLAYCGPDRTMNPLLFQEAQLTVEGVTKPSVGWFSEYVAKGNFCRAGVIAAEAGLAEPYLALVQLAIIGYFARPGRFGGAFNPQAVVSEADEYGFKRPDGRIFDYLDPKDAPKQGWEKDCYETDLTATVEVWQAYFTAIQAAVYAKLNPEPAKN